MVLLAVFFYTAAISVCEKGRRWQLAVGLWVAMQKSPNHVGMFLQEGLTGSACGASISAARVR